MIFKKSVKSEFNFPILIYRLLRTALGKIRSFFLNDYNILYIIITNSVVIFIQEFQHGVTAIDYFELCFTFAFLIEMLADEIRYRNI